MGPKLVYSASFFAGKKNLLLFRSQSTTTKPVAGAQRRPTLESDQPKLIAKTGTGCSFIPFRTPSGRPWVAGLLLAFLTLAVSMLGGCGSGGYPGVGALSLSRTSATIDAGQLIAINDTQLGAGGAAPVWTLAPVTVCPSSGCGSLANTGMMATYTAPTTVGATFQVQITLTDPDVSGKAVAIITVNPNITITGNLSAGTVGMAYSSRLIAAGGTGALTMSVASGSLPTGLSMDAAGNFTGTPTTAGAFTFVVQATDSATVPLTVKATETITITASASQLTVNGTLPAGTVGTAYSGSLTASGGTAPYTFSAISGTLPPGLGLAAAGAVTGTPTTPGTFVFTAQAQDSTGLKGTATFTVVISTAPLSITTGTLPNGTVGVAYASTIGVSGGVGPYSCSILSGALPAGLTLGANCAVTGTPTAAGTSTLSVRATDSSNPALTTSGPVSITINPAALAITTGTLPNGTVGTPYTSTIGVSGGTSPYSCSIVSGTLPAGLSLGGGCVVSGTPTVAGSAQLVIRATDSSNPAQSTNGPVGITIVAGATLILGTPPAGTVNTPYTGSIPVSGGTAPYTCTVTGGALPAGLTLGANCALSGTPTAAGTSTATIHATDSSNPALSTTGPVAITVKPMPPLTLTGTLPNGTVGVAYSQTLHASGGMAPYTYALTAGNLPAGLGLATNGTISGTPTAPGASSFTVTATDSEGTPQTASLPLVLLITYPTTPNDALLNGPYAFLFQGYDDALAGVLAYQMAMVGSFTADGTGVLSAGELDANHQTSNPAGTTVSPNRFLGTYTIGADDRGSLTITTLNADGTTAKTSTYAIAVKAPVAPATTATSGSLIEFDSNQLQGTKGSGTFLQQTASAFASSLNGSYAFGMQGDVVCFPACTVGVVGGPAASVGQFAANGAGAITVGTGDETIGFNTYASSVLSGTYGTADGNGRLSMSLTTNGVPLSQYPVDYAVYMVDANQAFVMSTDKHSAYILLAGSLHLQAGSGFSNASMSGAYVGYENSPTNPGLGGGTVTNATNLSTAYIFRGTANGSGTCTTTNVDGGGLVGVVNNTTGLGGLLGLPTIGAVLGSYESTGNSSCTVSANGREVLNYPVPNTVFNSALGPVLTLVGLAPTPPAPRVAYLYGPNQGFFLETGYAGLGRLEQQTGAPFSNASLNGTYVYQTSPAASAASTDTSGVFTADGAGHAQTTYDLNVGVGTLNVLQLGVTGTSNYNITDPTAGRFLLGATTVIYEISPGRFVLLDTNPAITSPSIALLF